MKRYFLILLSLLIALNTSFATWINNSFTFDGSTRSYRTYIPANYDPAKPASLIVVLHGLGGSMNDAASIGISEIADTANIILLSPQALDYENDLMPIEAAWNSGIEVTIPNFGTYPVNADVDDVGFIKAIMDTAMTHYNVNTARVYVCGASMGGFMAQRLACEAASRFAAIASVMGTYANALPVCNPGKVLPVVHFHGTNDEVINWNGEFLFSGNAFPVGLGVDSLIATWVDNNDCNTTPQHDTWPNNNNDNLYVEHFTYSDVNARSKVELFKINGGTHFWYQYANTGGEIDYAIEIWKFFNKQYGYSNGTSVIGINKSLPEIKLYPNPVINRLFVQTDIVFKNIQVMDIYGKVWATTKNISGGIDLGGITPGVYIIRFQTYEGKVAIAKFTKQ